ncbi:hypothetical protein MAMC_01026 [Methylacidimicrobium cyclopophantes]|uniref:Putative DNA-binding domain-containing protein n=1 Tax=Methylacidimicrobium cyclopophantes TaxID=1041766 RepID=A0A5E6MEP9_9BACT|nr:DNA-binding domain-containing protein [Methylacidimicrobium cyclopophantes]VVM06303.1 hypothetical protein MAMC_01026 [Methylacidimicrobium cyclopophantes]
MKPERPTASSHLSPRPNLKTVHPNADTVEGLRELQRLFFSAITRPLGPDGRAGGKSAPDLETAALAARLIRPGAKQSPLDRLEIYHRQYWIRLQQAFFEDFPGLWNLLGPERFRGLIEAYLLRYPPDSPLLREVGSHLPRFLREEPDWAAPFPHRLVLDLVRFEWAKIVTFYARELPLPRKEEMTTREIRLFLQPHLVLLDLRYPVERWDPEGSSSAPAGSPIPLSPEPRQIALHRQGETVYHKLLSRESFFLLRSFRKGLSLLEACERTAEKFPDLPPERYHEWLREWSSLGWLTTRTADRSRSFGSKTA